MVDRVVMAGQQDAETAPPALSIVIPVYDEAGNIERVTAEIAAVLAGVVPHEVIAVNDGSRDGSLVRLQEAQTRGHVSTIVRHAHRAGKSAALVSGIRAARAPWVLTLDGDGQNDPRDLLPLLDGLRTADPRLGLIAGQRQRRHDGIVKAVSSRLANTLRRTLLGDGTVDTGCGFKMLRRAAFADIPFFDGMHRFLPALVARAGWTVRQVPVNDRPRLADQSKYGITGRLVAGTFDLLGVIWLCRRARFPEVVAEPPERGAGLDTSPPPSP